MADELALEEIAGRLGVPAETDTDELFTLIEQRRVDVESSVRALPTGALRERVLARLDELQRFRDALRRHAGRSGQETTVTSEHAATRLEDVSLRMASSARAPSHVPARRIARVPELRRGQSVCDDRYVVTKIASRNVLGTVYAARDRATREQVALLTLAPRFVEDSDFRCRLMHEVEATVALHHPNIPRVEALHVRDEGSLLAMELWEGETLRERLDRRSAEGAPLSVAEVLDIAVQSARALAYAHERNLLHRDIRPENLLLTSDGVVKVMRFGITRMVDAQRPVREHFDFGWGGYVAPEEVHPGCRAGQQADQYALGVVLHEALTGRLPTRDRRPIRQLRSEIPRRLEAVIERLLSRESENRYGNSRRMVKALEACRPSIGERAFRRSPLVSTGAAVLVGLLLFFVFLDVALPTLVAHREERLAGEMIVVRGGSLLLGVSLADAPEEWHLRSQRYATLIHDYALGRYPVTQGQFEAVTGMNPSYHNTCGGRCPVESVSAYDAVYFTNVLNERLGLPPCYDHMGRVIDGQSVYECQGYRLPTTAEWTYAARAGFGSMYAGPLDAVAWNSGNCGDSVHPVGGKVPNAWGFHDILGNVQEFTASGSSVHVLGSSCLRGATTLRGLSPAVTYVPPGPDRHVNQRRKDAGFRLARTVHSTRPDAARVAEDERLD